MRETRWEQRFENFERAFKLLNSTFAEKSLEQFSDLEKEGIVQRFEYTFELAWKTLKDYLEYSGIMLSQITPRTIIKEATAAKIILDGQIWIEMLEYRNLMSHVYNEKSFQKAIAKISNCYLPVFEQTYLFFKNKGSAS